MNDWGLSSITQEWDLVDRANGSWSDCDIRTERRNLRKSTQQRHSYTGCRKCGKVEKHCGRAEDWRFTGELNDDDGTRIVDLIAWPSAG